MVRIATDSSSGITMEEGEKLGVTVVPLSINFGEESFVDDIEMTKEAFYEKLVLSKELPTTSQPAPSYFYDLFEDVKKKGDELVMVLISGKLSGTFATASAIKKEVGYEKIYLVDSLSTIGSMRFLVNEALRLKDDHSGEKIYSILCELRHRIRLLAIIDTLEYLKRGGRLSSIGAFIGNILNIKPILSVDDEGGAKILAKKPGFKMALSAVKNIIQKSEVDKSYGTYYGYTMKDERCKMLIEETKDLVSDKIIAIENVSGVVGTHIGTNGCVIIYVEKPKSQSQE